MTDSTDLDGAPTDLVRDAIASGDPLPGTGGFAGVVDGAVVRDVLGRRPLFLGRTDDGWETGESPEPLADPVPFPAGHVAPLAALSERSFDPEADPRRRWTLPDPDPTGDERAAVRDVASAVENAGVPEGCPVAFSGGVDSAVVASLSTGPLYVAGFPGSHDVAAARSAAAAMGRSPDLRVVTLTHDDLRRVVPRIARVTGRTNAMDVAIAAPLFLVAERVRGDGYDRLALGQGADELFGGYDKVAGAGSDPRVEAETVRGARRELVATLPDQLSRDVPTLRAAGVEAVAPFLHDGVVRSALALPEGLLVSDRGERKVALRLAGRRWLPDRVAFRRKKAVQYGTGVARELDRMAREAGFPSRLGDNVSAYVASLVE